jgi:acetyl esterase/lipase
VASVQSKLFTIFLRLIHKKSFLGIQLATKRFQVFARNEPPAIVRKTCLVHKAQINGRNVITLQPLNKKPTDTHILYLHGGAYIQSFNKFHWRFLSFLVKNTGCTIIVPDYPLAPSFTYKDSIEMVSAVYEQLNSTVSTNNLILMGDSAGGGLALAFAQKLVNDHRTPPSQIILLSPWLDITLTNPDIDDLVAIDPFLEKKSLQTAGALFAGNADPNHYLLSPVNGSLRGLQQITLIIGSKEILLPDARKLKSIAEKTGVELNFYEYEDMVHGWMFLNFPESKKVRRQIVDLIVQS